MKMTDEDYNKLKEQLEIAVYRIGPYALREHRRLKLGKRPDVRFAWDIFALTRLTIGYGVNSSCPGDLNLYAYLDDGHITTALVKYVRENPSLQIA